MNLQLTGWVIRMRKIVFSVPITSYNSFKATQHKPVIDLSGKGTSLISHTFRVFARLTQNILVPPTSPLLAVIHGRYLDADLIESLQ